MLKHFGSKVRNLRVTRNITREDFCGDETELSVRQLARIESGQSIPNLTKAHYIAKQLNVKLDILTGGESLELPKRYKELKYLILRIPTYADAERLKLRECQFDHIFEEFYDNLPEDECLAIDSLQAKFEVYQTGDINFGVEVLCECFDKVKYKDILEGQLEPDKTYTILVKGYAIQNDTIKVEGSSTKEKMEYAFNHYIKEDNS